MLYLTKYNAYKKIPEEHGPTAVLLGTFARRGVKRVGPLTSNRDLEALGQGDHKCQTLIQDAGKAIRECRMQLQIHFICVLNFMEYKTVTVKTQRTEELESTD